MSLKRQETIRGTVLTMAAEDPAILGAAVTGSHARGVADQWSDIDLFFGYVSGSTFADTAESWTHKLDEQFGVAHYFDLASNDAVYRAFLLDEGMELDIGFADNSNFRSVPGEAFDVVFGTSVESDAAATSTEGGDRTPLGYAWHHLKHGYVCLERRQLWQGLYWTTALRDVLTTRMCRRRGLPTNYGKGVDLMPTEVRAELLKTVPTRLAVEAMRPCLDQLAILFLTELEKQPDHDVDRLSAALPRLHKPTSADEQGRE